MAVGPATRVTRNACLSESPFLNLHGADCEPRASAPRDSPLSLHAEKALSQAKSVTEQKRFPFAPDNDSTSEELAIAYVLIGSGLYDEAIRHFSTMLQILSPLGRISEAVSGLTRAIQLQPSARLCRHRGTLHFMSEDYATAHEDPQLSLELNRNQPIAMLYKGLTFFHRGLLKEAIESFKEALKQKVDFIDAYKSLGQAYRELGNFEAATESFQKALLLDQNHVQTLQLRGVLLYHHGSLRGALRSFKRCLQLEPYNEVCQYMKGLSHVAMGQFYEGVKAQTKVMLSDPLPGQKASPEYLKVKYLREYSRYLHAHLDTPLTEYSVDVDLPGSFKDRWAKNLPFLLEDYKEQPGLQPHIKCFKNPHPGTTSRCNIQVQHPGVAKVTGEGPISLWPSAFDARLWESGLVARPSRTVAPAEAFRARALEAEARVVRAALPATALASPQRNSQPAFRARRAGPAPPSPPPILQVLCLSRCRALRHGQVVRVHLYAALSRRVADPDQPVLWLDQMPARSLSRGFTNHINLIRGQVINMRYLEYFEKILHFIKDRILVYHGPWDAMSGRPPRDHGPSCSGDTHFRFPRKQFNTKTKDGFTVSTKVPSLKDHGKEHDGFTITVTGDKIGNILFSVETQTTEERTQLYHAEIDALYKDLTAKGKVLILSSELGEADAVCNLILSLVYYFYNLMPLSRGSSVIAYSVIVGALMASGKEVAGKIPKGKLVDFEAMTAPGSEAFSKIAKSWMNLKSQASCQSH
ncbi:tetratricopeptide repeat protein 13 [Pteropus vampyrus]|uniref:Tetratricopeptide repeat protein 13 n=1 Tax=Pteropus vampyrus TaxID=132908 RepID=A0A6P6BWQ7_PTEVA|nr:tetratricopeptide repeat protein 13 [Pteropus vampyrus]